MRTVSATVGRLAACVLAVLSSAAPATAQVDEGDTEGNLRGRVTSAWPIGITHGYVPVRLEVTNRDEERGCIVDIDVLNEPWRGRSSRVLETAVLEPGETVFRDLLLPCSNTGDAGWEVELRSSRNDRVDFRFYGYGGRTSVLKHFVLVVLPPGAPAVDTAPWAESIKTGDVSDDRRAAAPGEASTEPNAVLSVAEPSDLPPRHEGYSSLDAVVVDLRLGLPDDARLAPLLEWARKGGTLMLSGPRATELAVRHPSLAPWLEPRFTRFEGEGTQAYHFMQGTLIVADTPHFLEDEEANELLRRALAAPTSWVPTAFAARAAQPQLELPGFEELPFAALTFFLMAFAVVIGPLNFALARKLGRTYLTLATIPAVSLAACVALLAYAFLHQGIDAKLSSETWTLLDQRTRRADTADVRLFWAGLAPAAGLRPAAGTSVHPALLLDRDDTSQYRLEQRDGALFSGEFLPTRKATRQVVLSDRAARGRLAFEPDGVGWSVQNGLEVQLEDLLVRDADGDYWSLPTPLAPDARASLTFIDPEEAEAWVSELSGGIPLLGSVHRLVPATYAARLADSPFRDDLGVEWTELAARHRLFGVVARQELAP